MEKSSIETGPKTFPEYDRGKHERIFLQRVSEISRQNAELSAELHGGNLNLEAPVKEELLAHLGGDLTELKNTRDDLSRKLAA